MDYLKIDRSFIRNSNNNQKNADLVEIIILLAHKLKMKVIAEGCETKEDLEKLKKLKLRIFSRLFFLQTNTRPRNYPIFNENLSDSRRL